MRLAEQTQDTDGVIYAGETDDPPYVAIGFRAKKPGGTYRYIWLYKVKFSTPDEEYQTKENTAEPTDDTAKAWFTAVKVKAAA